MTRSPTNAQKENVARINRDARGRGLADKSRRATRSVRNKLGLRSQPRRFNFDGRNQRLPNNRRLNLRLSAACLIEKDADIAVVIAVDAAASPERRCSISVLTSRQRKMVVMSILRNQFMQPIPQHRDPAIYGEQKAGNKLVRDSPHGGTMPAKWDSLGRFVNSSRKGRPRQQKSLQRKCLDGCETSDGRLGISRFV